MQHEHVTAPAALPDAGPLFDRAAGIYDRTRRLLIPCFDAFYGAVPALIERAPDDELTVLDLGAGTGLMSQQLAHAFPRARFLLVDVAEQMLEVARQRFADEPEGRFRFAIGDLASFALPPRQDVVLSALAIHHLDHAAKRDLFARVHAALVPGGVFVNAEQVLAPTAEAEHANHHCWLAEVQSAGIAQSDLAAALERMKADRLATLDEQLGWLRDAGFVDVRCAFQAGRFAVYSGRRAA
jgi:ubiquinone/menaquinone biosynthesis C-methylase UbiE